MRRTLSILGLVAVLLIACGGDDELPTPPPDESAVNNNRAATFGIRAMRQAGLQDREHNFFLYSGVDVIDDGWKVSFSSGNYVLNVIERNGALAVRDIKGFKRLPEVADIILSYEEPAESE